MRNGHLEYVADGVRHAFNIYITEASQDFTLSGAPAQTRLKQQFYPRGYSPGNMSITGQATSQDEMQRFAKFIRNHHVTMINTPGKMAFTKLDTHSPGYQRLMRLYIDAEGILYRGWIPSFTMRKEGVMKPAPTFTFDFFVVFDSHSSDIYASRQVQKLWWQQAGDPVINVGGKTVEKPPMNTESDQPGFDIIETITSGDPVNGIPGVISKHDFLSNIKER